MIAILIETTAPYRLNYSIHSKSINQPTNPSTHPSITQYLNRITATLSQFINLIKVRAIYTLRSAALTYGVNTLDKNGEPVDLDDGSDDYNDYFRVRQTVELWRVGRNLLAIGVFINFGRAFKYVRASRRLSQVKEKCSR